MCCKNVTNNQACPLGLVWMLCKNTNFVRIVAPYFVSLFKDKKTVVVLKAVSTSNLVFGTGPAVDLILVIHLYNNSGNKETHLRQ